jgi:GDP-fucose transporter C1
MIVFGEISIISEYEYFFSFDFWFPISLSGLLGFGMSYVTVWQIQVTSPLTHNISGTAKAAFQTVMATQWYSEYKTGLWWISNLLVSFSQIMTLNF